MKGTRADRSYVVGVDVGGTKILTALLDAELQIVALKKTRTRREAGVRDMLKQLAETITETIASADVPRSAVKAIGVGVPGLVGHDRQTVVLAPNLQWVNVNVSEHLESTLRIPVVTVNDVEAGTLAVQKLGAGRELRHFVCLFVGTGIGGGIVLDGKRYRGANGLGAEIGHLALVTRNAPKCSCGQRGCLEALASRTAIVNRLLAAKAKGSKSLLWNLCGGDVGRIRSRTLAEAYRAGDKLVTEAVDDAAHYIGAAVANLVNLLNPEAVVMGGGLVEALGSEFIDRIGSTARKRCLPPLADKVNVCDTGLGDYAGVFGAGLAAFA